MTRKLAYDLNLLRSWAKQPPGWLARWGHEPVIKHSLRKFLDEYSEILDENNRLHAEIENLSGIAFYIPSPEIKVRITDFTSRIPPCGAECIFLGTIEDIKEAEENEEAITIYWKNEEGELDNYYVSPSDIEIILERPN